MSVFNNFTLIGRIAQEPRIFENSDGSKKFVMNLAVQRNYTVKDPDTGETTRPVDYLPVQRYIKAGMNDSFYQGLKVGERVAVMGDLRKNDYTDSKGVAHYDVTINATEIERMESKSAVEAREAARAAEVEADLA